MLRRLRRSGGGDARRWLERAAYAGYRDAMNALGDFYARLTEPPDLHAARHWYERAAQRGHRRALKNLRALDEEFLHPAGHEWPGFHLPGCFSLSTAVGQVAVEFVPTGSVAA